MSEPAPPSPSEEPPYQPPAYQQPTFEQPSWQTPGPVYGPPPPLLPFSEPVYGQPGQPPTPYAWSYAVNHPTATTALVLGIVSIVGLLACQLLLVLGPIAWVMGAKARKEIDREPQRYTGRSSATAGMVMGIISTVLLVLGVVGFAVLIAVNS